MKCRTCLYYDDGKADDYYVMSGLPSCIKDNKLHKRLCSDYEEFKLTIGEIIPGVLGATMAICLFLFMFIKLINSM